MIETRPAEEGNIAIQDMCSPDNPSATRSHHWLIKTPAGETSLGKYKFCPAEREFKNSHPGRRWEDPAVEHFRDVPRRFDPENYE